MNVRYCVELSQLERGQGGVLGLFVELPERFELGFLSLRIVTHELPKCGRAL